MITPQEAAEAIAAMPSAYRDIATAMAREGLQEGCVHFESGAWVSISFGGSGELTAVLAGRRVGDTTIVLDAWTGP